MKEEHFWYWINNITGVGRKTIREMIDYFGTPKEVYCASETDIAYFIQETNCRNVMHSFLLSRNEENIERHYARLLNNKIDFLYPGHFRYPEKLENIPDPPMGLYLKGQLPQQQKKAVAIIGARDCTHYGEEMAHYFGRELAKCGVAVISGLARGIDGMAHKGALDGDGYTLGIIGGGIDNVYPEENYQLFMQMERRGGILSESNMGIRPVAGLFPQRNRLIAGLCDGILVVEAKEKSGTFITVDQGLDQGKEIFAIPGRIEDCKSIGCNNLIKMGAHIVTEVHDILEILHIEENCEGVMSYSECLQSISSKMLLAPLEKMVYSCLRINPRNIDDIIEDVRVAPQDVCKALNRMALEGIIAEPTRNYYAIKL